MTDGETTVEVLEVFNPYDAAVGDDYYLNRAWTSGKEEAKNPDQTIACNPHNEANEQAVWQAFNEGFEGTGLGIQAFNHPIPNDENGIFIVPDLITMTGKWDKRRATPVLVWNYDPLYDKQDPKVKPLWFNFPARVRCIQIADGHAWAAARRWMSNEEIRGGKTYDLPCPPYGYEHDGGQLTITAGFFSKSGSKKEWTEVLEQMQEEVENMEEGFYIGDDYLSVTLSANVTATASVSSTALLYGHEQMGEDDLWIGTDDEYHDAVVEAANDYDFTDDIEPDGIDLSYVEWDIDDTDTSELSAG